MTNTRSRIRDILAFLLFLPMSPLAIACELSVGWEPWPPVAFETADGEVSGLDGDLLNAIASEMGCEVTWVQTTWKRSLQAVESGEIDLVMSASLGRSRDGR